MKWGVWAVAGLASLTGAVDMASLEVTSASLFSVEPIYASFGGGTWLTITGAGFSGDEYLGGNRVLIGGEECPLDKFYTTEFRLVCELPPYKGTTPREIPVGWSHPNGDTNVKKGIEVLVDGVWASGNELSVTLTMDRTPLVV